MKTNNLRLKTNGTYKAVGTKMQLKLDKALSLLQRSFIMKARLLRELPRDKERSFGQLNIHTEEAFRTIKPRVMENFF